MPYSHIGGLPDAGRLAKTNSDSETRAEPLSDRSDTIPKALRRRTRVITQEQPFTCAVGALDGQLEVDHEIAVSSS